MGINKLNKIKKTIKCLPKLSFPKTSKKNNKETLNSEKLLNKPEKPDNKKTNKKNNNGSNNLTNTNKNTWNKNNKKLITKEPPDTETNSISLLNLKLLWSSESEVSTNYTPSLKKL